MKKAIYLLGIIVFMLSSCVDDNKDLSQGKDDTPQEEFDSNFNFDMRTEHQIKVIAKHPDGTASTGVPFCISFDNPYGEEGNRLENVPSVYSGATNEKGEFVVKVAVPNQVTEIYVYTPYEGYGTMQSCDVSNEMNLTFQGGNVVSSPTRAGDSENHTREGKVYNAENNVYIYYQNGIYDTFSGLFNNGVSSDPELIGTEDITKGISEKANSLFKEGKAVDDDKYLEANSDLVVKRPDDMKAGETYTGTEIWVTFIGDGGFSINNGRVMNSLCYYTYPTNNPPAAKDAQNIHKTLLYPNTNIQGFGQSLIGSKIQLLYWDEVKHVYTSTFPEGVSIGWIMVSGISNKNKVDDLSAYRFSTPALNDRDGVGDKRGSFANGIARWCDAGYNVVGMENRLHNDKDVNNDMDYNDILFKVESNPIIKPGTDIPVPDKSHKDSSVGTLAFEDNWPQMGDYDFNDFVTGYTYTLVKETESATTLKAIQLVFKPKAIGAVFQSGFGIQLPIKASHVKSIAGGRLETDAKSGLATVIVYDNVRSAFDNASGFINTNLGSSTLASTPATIDIVLNENAVASSADLFSKFNPFIFVTERGNEIHLTDKAPTSEANMSLFNTGVDKSVVANGKYYRMENQYPWALDIPAITTTAIWSYPIEGTIITEVYLDYAKWVTVDGHKLDWINSNVVTGKIYK